MRNILLWSTLLLLLSCNPYRQIAGDYGKRKPFERDILLQEAEREAPRVNNKPEVVTYDSSRLKDHILVLEENLRLAQDELDNVAQFADSIYKDNADYIALKKGWQSKIDDLSSQIKALKNAPPVVKEVKVPWEDKYQIELLTGSISKLKQDLYAKDLQLVDANKKVKDAEQRAKEALQYKWLFFGLLAVIGVGVVLLFRFKIL